MPGSGTVILIGAGRLARGVDACLRAEGADVLHLPDPGDPELRDALERGPEAVIVATLDDIDALRWALLVEYMRPGVRLIVTIFDRTVAGQVRGAVRNCAVVSAADLAVASLLGPCVDEELLALTPVPGEAPRGARSGPSAPELVRPERLHASRVRRARGWLRSQLRPIDAGSRMLLVGAFGLVGVLVVDTLLGVARGERLIESAYSAMKVIATVDADASIDRGSEGTKAVATASILLAALFFAAFAAGLVQRLLDRRLIAIVGSRTLPREDHVVVVGLGHFGFRLAGALHALGVRVVAVERNGETPNVRLAKRAGIPVIVGDGSERLFLETLSLGRARALATVTSDDVTNISVAVAALAVRPGLRVVLRAFEGAVTEESQALFKIGVVRDVFAIASAGLAAAALGRPGDVVVQGNRTFLLEPNGTAVRFPRSAEAGGQPR